MKIHQHSHIKHLLSLAEAIYQIPIDKYFDSIKKELLVSFDNNYFKYYEYYISNRAGQYAIVHVTPKSLSVFETDEILREKMKEKLILLISGQQSRVIAGYFLSGICLGEYEYQLKENNNDSIQDIFHTLEKIMLKQSVLFSGHKLPEEIFIKNSTESFNELLKAFFIDRQNPKKITAI